MIDDDVEFVARADIAGDRKLAADHAQIGLDRFRRGARGARRAIEAVADAAANAQRRRIDRDRDRSEEHTSELPSLMRISYAVLCLKKQHNKATQSSQQNELR